MSEIILSINPEYVDKIITGKKRFEYRTKIPKKEVDKIIIYCTFPTMKILAEADIKKILALPPKELWERTKKRSGISEEKYFEYFKGRDIAYAFALGKINKFAQPKELSDFGCMNPPQSFVYVNKKTLRRIELQMASEMDSELW